MKRAKNLFPQIISFENLLISAQKARRGKKFQSQPLLFHHCIEEELIRLQEELATGTYLPGEYRSFAIYDTKKRIISAAPYRDRIVHHALCAILEPIYEPVFIHHSYACRVGKGTHAAVDQLTRHMKRYSYFMQLDIQRYFPSIDREILKRLLERKIGCSETLNLISTILDNSPPESSSREGAGLPIGNQTSQFFANVYLNPLDHFIIENLKCEAYLRYADDFILLSNDKSELHRMKAEIENFLKESLNLNLHPLRQRVAPVSESASFLGYRVFPSHRRLLAANGWAFVRRLYQMQKQYRSGLMSQEQIRSRAMAWIGHAAHADTYGLRAAIFENAAFSRASS